MKKLKSPRLENDPSGLGFTFEALRQVDLSLQLLYESIRHDLKTGDVVSYHTQRKDGIQRARIIKIENDWLTIINCNKNGSPPSRINIKRVLLKFK